MALLQDKDRKYLAEEFKQLKQPVKLLMFTMERECQYCVETRQIVEELANLHKNVRAEIYDFVGDKEVVETYGIDKIPAIAIVESSDTPQDYGIRYYGIPSGYEFSSLVQAILMVGSGDSGLPENVKAEVTALEEDLHLQVFVTPTCPYCPGAVHLAHQMAMASERIKADMVEATEFPHLAMKYQVMGVPRTVINETGFVEGMVSEEVLLQHIEQTMKQL